MKPRTLLIVCSEGGHLAEALALSSAFEDFRSVFVAYQSRQTLPGKFIQMPNIAKKPIYLPLFALKMVAIFLRERPHVMLSTGSEIAVPFFILAKLLGVRTIFIETLNRTTEQSFTGKWAYKLVNVFLVQWPSMIAVYGPKARYLGSILDEA